MNERKLSASILADYDRWLRQEERADATREKYLRSIRTFAECHLDAIARFTARHPSCPVTLLLYQQVAQHIGAE